MKTIQTIVEGHTGWHNLADLLNISFTPDVTYVLEAKAEPLCVALSDTIPRDNAYMTINEGEHFAWTADSNNDMYVKCLTGTGIVVVS